MGDQSPPPSINDLNKMIGVDGNRQEAINWIVNRITYAEVLSTDMGIYSQERGNMNLAISEKALNILGVAESEIHSGMLLLPLKKEVDNGESE